MSTKLPGKQDVFAVESWRTSAPEDELRFLEWMRSGTVPGTTSWWMSDGRVRPSDLYCYLKARFGPPRGLLSILRRPTSDELFHWHFHVAIGMGRFEAISSNRGTEFRVVCADALSKEDQGLIIDLIKADFARVAQEMKEVRDSLEPWTLFINPYARLTRVVREYYDQLDALEAPEPHPPAPSETAPDHATIQQFYQELQRWGTSLHEVSQAALILQLLTPVLGEAFVNLVIFVLADADLRGDSRLYEARIRDHIDVRLRGLHQICRGFRGPLDPNAEEFKAYQTIMNRRNDLLHGNVDPLRHQFDKVFFDETVPVFREEDLLLTRLPRLANESLDREDTLRAVDSLSEFILYVLSCLEPGAREHLLRVMDEQFLGWREDVGRVGILFPDALAVGFASSGGTAEGDDESHEDETKPLGP